MTDAQAALESLEHMCRFLEDEHGFRRGGSKIAQDLALVRQEIERLEAEVARLRPLAAPVWPDDPDALR